jgi:hypothetical protein
VGVVFDLLLALLFGTKSWQSRLISLIAVARISRYRIEITCSKSRHRIEITSCFQMPYLCLILTVFCLIILSCIEFACSGMIQNEFLLISMLLAFCCTSWAFFFKWPALHVLGVLLVYLGALIKWLSLIYIWAFLIRVLNA